MTHIYRFVLGLLVAWCLLLASGCSDVAVSKEAVCDGRLQTNEDTVDSPFDVDGDGFFDAGNRDCADAYDADRLDCDDSDAAISPDAVEVLCTGIDEDCDETTPDDSDADLDTSGSCLDCDDNDAANYPGGVELCDGQDNDCDLEVDEGLSTDGDGDGHTTPGSCEGPDDDCDDSDPDNHPGNVEVCDVQDNDCDGVIDNGIFSVDGDVDGHYSIGSCLVPADDCNDSESSVYPGAAELCDGLDNDCNNLVDDGVVCCVDSDGDGYDDDSCGGTDCDDLVFAINPGAPEICDGIDNNCDARIDEGQIDDDADGVCNDQDICPLGDDGIDLDSNGIPDACDVPPGSTSLRFDGVDDYVQVPHSAGLNIPAAGITVEAWMFNDTLTNCQTSVRKGTSQLESEYWLHKNYGPEDSLHWSNSTSGGPSAFLVQHFSAISAGVWYHYAGIYDPVGGQARNYINGVLGVTSSASSPPGMNLEDVLMGIDWDGGCQLNGVMDEVRISAGVRYNSNFVPELFFANDANTLGLWHFDEGSGTTVLDSSGNGNHGTIYGAVYSSEGPL